MREAIEVIQKESGEKIKIWSDKFNPEYHELEAEKEEKKEPKKKASKKKEE